MVLILFWVCVGLIAYTYFIFPVLVFLRGLLWPQLYKSEETIPLPMLSIIISAYNEEKAIGEKLENLLSLDYLPDRMEVVIASDGSTDDTDAVIRGYEGQGIKLLSLPRQGKAAALNAAVAVSKGEILVFSDANSIYKSDALRALVRPFADPNIGGVAGNQCYLKKNGKSLISAGERSYWDFDRVMKEYESRAGSTISATGAIYAIRHSLFHNVSEGVTDDFVTSTSVIAQGYRLVFASDALAYEYTAGTRNKEFGRKVRVITRGLRAIFFVRSQLLNPLHYGFYAIQLFSHKVLRRLIVFPLIILFFLNLFLMGSGPFYSLLIIGQLFFYGLGILGLMLDETRFGKLRIFTIPFYFCLVNAAVLVATINILQGRQIKRWEPQREVESA